MEIDPSSETPSNLNPKGFPKVININNFNRVMKDATSKPHPSILMFMAMLREVLKSKALIIADINNGKAREKERTFRIEIIPKDLANILSNL
jgi:hypothetical protein